MSQFVYGVILAALAQAPAAPPRPDRLESGLPIRSPAPARPAPAQPPGATQPSRASAAQIENLLAQLASPRYSVRENATQALCQLGQSDLPLLTDAYRRENRYEPKRRIRYVIEYVFHRDQIVGRDGFMGVEVVLQVLSELTDPVSGLPTRAVVVKRVKPGFAGQRAGLQDNDLIIALDGEPLPEDPSTATFVSRVGSHAPGTMLSLRILRADPPQTLRLTLGADPTKLLLGARLIPIAPELGPQGMLIAAVEEDSPAARAGLKRNQILKSVEGIPLGSYVNQLDGVLRNYKPGDQARLEIAPMQVRSLDIRLGSRPPEFIQDPKDLAEARTRFMRWWQDQGGDLPSRAPEPVQRAFLVNVPPAKIAPETTIIP